MSSHLLRRLQDGALASRLAEDDVKAAVRYTLNQEGQQ